MSKFNIKILKQQYIKFIYEKHNDENTKLLLNKVNGVRI